MFQLIIAVIAIALVALLAAASINYLPGWNKVASDVEAKVRVSLGSVEQAFDVATRSMDGTAPAVTDTVDGGFRDNFLPYLRFMPPTPVGYAWVYGLRPVESTPWSGMHYFCLRPSAGTSASEGMIRGVKRAKSSFSPDQLFLSGQCGDTANWSQPDATAGNLHITFFVAYTPGVSR